MKKGVLVILVLVILGIAGWMIWGGKKESTPEQKQQPLKLADNSDTFNQSFGVLLGAYFKVKDALVASDTAKASAAALELATAADSLKVNEIKGDSLGVIKLTAQDYAGTISGSAKGLAGENNIEAKRKEFKMIADALYTLFQTVRYKEQKIYWIHCPMAFNNTGAYWINQDSTVRNPYFGDKMLTCGTVEGTLDFTQQ
jgi:hypothetical protein